MSTVTVNSKFFITVHSIAYHQMLNADLIEFEHEGKLIETAPVGPVPNLFPKIKGTNLYLRFDDKCSLELKRD